MIIKAKVIAHHGDAQLAGTDVIRCDIYNARSLASVASAVADLSLVDNADAELNFLFDSSSWPSNSYIYIGVSLQQGARINVPMIYPAYSNLTGCVVDTGIIFFEDGEDPLEFVSDDNPWIKVYIDDVEVGGCGDDLGDTPDYHRSLSFDDATVVKLPPLVIYGGDNPLPNKAVLQNPPDGSYVYSSFDLLNWSSGGLTSDYNVYFGPTGAMELVSYAQQSTGYSDLSLNDETGYQWRIDTINSNGLTTGDTWSFTTFAEIKPPEPSGLNNMLVTKRLVTAAKNKIYYEDI